MGEGEGVGVVAAAVFQHVGAGHQAVEPGIEARRAVLDGGVVLALLNPGFLGEALVVVLALTVDP